MRTFTPALLALALCGAPLCAQQPPPSIDQLAADVVGIRTKRAELEKAEAEKLGAIAAELKRQRELLEKLGLDTPTPKPPAPVPPPVPVPPVDPLRSKLKAAFDAALGASADKAEWARDLAALYRAAAKLAADPTLATAGTLRAKLKDASAALIGSEALKEVRQAVAVELAAVLPTTDADLTDAHRAAAAALFKALAGHLEELAK